MILLCNDAALVVAGRPTADSWEAIRGFWLMDVTVRPWRFCRPSPLCLLL